LSAGGKYWKYAREEKGDHGFELTTDNMKLFLAVLLLSGYDTLPRLRMHWEQQPVVFNAAVYIPIKEQSAEVILVQCPDRNIVTLASNCHSVLPLNHARRWTNKARRGMCQSTKCCQCVLTRLAASNGASLESRKTSG
jgi:hypothetical protein